MKTDGCSSKAQQQFIIDEAVINNLKNIDVEAELKGDPLHKRIHP